MFDTLSGRLDDIFTRLRSKGRLSEKQIDEVLREIRLALLEADVSLKVVKAFVRDVKERAEGAEIHKSLTPAQQVIKLVHGALIDVLGHETVGLQPAPAPPRVILLAGLQGSGKTTASAKLARLLKSQGRKPLLAACDQATSGLGPTGRGQGSRRADRLAGGRPRGCRARPSLRS
jgi:signal recognition particle subunit SRP54